MGFKKKMTTLKSCGTHPTIDEFSRIKKMVQKFYSGVEKEKRLRLIHNLENDLKVKYNNYIRKQSQSNLSLMTIYSTHNRRQTFTTLPILVGLCRQVRLLMH